MGPKIEVVLTQEGKTQNLFFMKHKHGEGARNLILPFYVLKKVVTAWASSKLHRNTKTVFVGGGGEEVWYYP
jgi:hypothetical protein